MTNSTHAHDVPHAALRRRRRLWIAAAIFIGLCILIPLVYLQTVRQRAATPAQRSHLAHVGAVLRQYAQQHESALPEQLSAASAAPDADSLRVDPATNRPITYRIVTASGERLRYEPYGDRVVAWTEPDARGRRWVLLNNLDEVVSVLDADLDQHELQIQSMGALNRVRGMEAAE